MGNFSFTIDRDNTRTVIGNVDTERSAKNIISDTIRFIETKAKLNVPQRTGNLFRSISKEGPIKISSSEYVGIVSTGFSAPYARFVEYGTGMYGSRKSPIFSKTGNYMKWRENSKIVFAKSTKGQKPQLYMTKAVEEAISYYLPKRLAQEAKNITKE